MKVLVMHLRSIEGAWVPKSADEFLQVVVRNEMHRHGWSLQGRPSAGQWLAVDTLCCIPVKLTSVVSGGQSWVSVYHCVGTGILNPPSPDLLVTF